MIVSVSRKIWLLFFGILATIGLLFLSYFLLKSRQDYIYMKAVEQSADKILESFYDNYEDYYHSYIRDYSSWDELVQFTKNGNRKWADDNVAMSVSNYKLNYLNIYNGNEELIYSPDRHLILNEINSEIFRLLRENKSIHYFITRENKPVEVFATTINSSVDVSKTGKIFGFFVVGLEWNEAKIKMFENLTGLKMTIYQGATNIPNSRRDMQIYKYFPDYNGKTNFTLIAVSEDRFLRQARVLSWIELFSLILLSFILLLLASATIHRHISLPLKKINIALKTKNPDKLDSFRTKDEFSEIARMMKGFFLQEKLLLEETNRLKELQANLIISENKFRSYFDNSPEAIVIMNEEGNFVQVNLAAINSTGYSSEELLNMNYMDITFKEDLDQGQEDFNNLIENRYLRNEIRVVTKDGTVLYALINSFMTKDNLVISFIQDISVLKMKELALKSSEVKFMTLFYSSPIAVALATQDKGIIIDVNTAFEEMSGFSKNELLGKDTREIGFSNPEDRAIFYEKIQHNSYIKNMRYRFYKKNGVERFGLLSGNKLDTGHDKVLLITITDITEIKKIEEELYTLNRTLETRVREELDKNREKDVMMIKQSRLAAMGETIHNIAHQWRQPLNALGILIQNIKNHIEDKDFISGYLVNFEKKAINLVLHLSRTIDDFRNFFKLDREKTTFQLQDVILQTVGIIDATYQNNYIALELNINDKIEISGYPNEYAQVLLNILNNSKEVFSEKNTCNPIVKINLGVEPESGKSVVTITDNGGGIPEDIMQNVFDIYFTTKNTGSGIGLYMSKYIIEKRMNGKINIKNVPDGLEVKIIV